MANPLDRKTSQLPTATSIAGTEYMYGIQGGVSKKFPVTLLGTGEGGGSLISVLQVLTSDALVNVPDAGFYAVVHYNIAADTTPTGFPAATGSRKIYFVENLGAGSITLHQVNGGDFILPPFSRVRLEDYDTDFYLITG